MNTRILVPTILVATLAFTGCAKKEAPLSEPQQAFIRQEVIQTMQTIIAAEERLDTQTVWVLRVTP